MGVESENASAFHQQLTATLISNRDVTSHSFVHIPNATSREQHYFVARTPNRLPLLIYTLRRIADVNASLLHQLPGLLRREAVICMCEEITVSSIPEQEATCKNWRSIAILHCFLARPTVPTMPALQLLSPASIRFSNGDSPCANHCHQQLSQQIFKQRPNPYNLCPRRRTASLEITAVLTVSTVNMSQRSGC